MIRFFDLIFSFFGLIFLLPLLLFIIILCFIDTRSPIFKQKRLGKNKKIFNLIKFRSMNIKTKSIATHLVDENLVTSLGRFLRKTKLDELPQLWNVLVGNMSLVGPRPCLPNQYELILIRENYKIFSVRPGITGLSQIKNIDMSTPELLAKTDSIMINQMSVKKYFKYIVLTIIGKGIGDKIKPR